MKNILAYLVLAATIIFNLRLYYPETQILADPNDNIFQYSLVGRTNWIWENYGCPFSPSCLPNLIDHNVPNWAEGYPLPFYYSHIPQIAIVSSYNLVIKPIVSLLTSTSHFPLLTSNFSLYQYYNFTKYLLLTLFPLSVFFALRLVGFSPVLAAFGAFFGANFSTDGLYGIDPPSYLWRGYGLTSQLYGIFFLPLAIAFVFRALKDENSKHEARNSKYDTLNPDSGQARMTSFWGARRVTPESVSKFGFRISDLSLAILFLTATTAGHLGIGIIGLLSTIPFLFLDFKVANMISRFKKLFLILASCFLILSYWLIPILLNNNYHIISFWDPIWKFNSYGWYEAVKQLFNGEIFDWQRFPIITALVLIGFFALLVRRQRHSGESRVDRDDSRIPTRSWTSQDDNLHVFSLLFSFWFMLYFGRTTWGGLIDLIPGMKDFHQHRFVVGIHMAAIFLIPAGLEWIIGFFRKLIQVLFLFAFGGFRKFLLPSSKGGETDVMSEGSPRLLEVRETRKPPLAALSFPNFFGQAKKWENYQNITFYIIIFIFISLLVYLITKQTVTYATLNNKWIYQANDAYRYDENNFKNMLAQIDPKKGRVYAGRPGNWGKDFRLGSTQLYLLFGGIGYDISQFLPETWSPLSENEQNFDEREALDYDLLNIKYVVSSKNQGFAPAVKLAQKYGPFELYSAPTTGWFDVVSSPMFVKTDKTNYTNIVHLWWNSYSRRWKMNPLISVEKNPQIPDGMKRVLTMTDEVSYQESEPREHLRGGEATTSTPRTVKELASSGGGTGTKNIFSSFPFVFPEATVSAYLKDSGQDTPKDTWKVAEGLLPGGGIGKDGSVAVISNEKVTEQTYSAQFEVPDNCNQCMAMFKMSYHPNWQVKVDGKAASKFAVFPFYLATPVTPGTHTLEFSYEPNRLKAILVIIEIIIFIIFIWYRIFLRR